MLWPELDPYDRFAAARDAGFQAVEMLFPQWLDESHREKALSHSGLELVLFDPLPGDWGRGERGMLCIPGRQDELIRTIVAGVELAKRLGTKRLNCLAGVAPADVPSQLAVSTAVRNLHVAAELAQAEGVTILVEGINASDMPGYMLAT